MNMNLKYIRHDPSTKKSTIRKVICGISNHSATTKTENAFFSGNVSAKTVRNGFQVMYSDLIALKSSDHAADFTDIFAVRVPLDVRKSLVHWNGNPLTIPHGFGIKIATDETVNVEGSYEANYRYQDLIINVSDPEAIDDDLAAMVIQQKKQNCAESFHVGPDMRAQLRDLCNSENDDQLINLKLENCVLELVVSALSGTGPKIETQEIRISERDRRAVKLVFEKLLAEPEANHSLRDLSQAAGVSVTNLKTKFRLIYGKSVINTLREIRLNLAKEAIENNYWSVSQAAYNLGYRHQSSFSKAFHRQYGIWPAQVIRKPY
ncbi:MAG: helix-turn-helix transcriptional regulator [Pseudomonadota bacterium]